MVEIHITHRPFIRFKHESLSEKAIGGTALAISTVSGSTFTAFAKKLTTSLSSLSLLFVSELLTGFFVLFSFGLIPTLKNIFNLHLKELKWMLLIGVLSGVGGPMFWFTGLSYTTAINAGFFARSEMIFLMILASFILKEKITKAHIAAIIAIFAGILTVSFRGFTEVFALRSGDILIIIATFCYGSSNIIFRKYLSSKVEPHLVLFTRSCAAIATFFLISPFIEHPFISEIMAFPLLLLPALFAFGFISRFLNSVMYYEAIDRLPVATVSLVSSLDIIGITFFAYLFLGETVHWYHYLGGAFLILGNVLLELLGTHPTEEHLEQHLKQRLP